MTSPADLDAIRARLAAATPGPWFWRNTSLDVWLQGDGTRIVMAFRRHGMNSAQPEFRNPHTNILDPVAKENINTYPDALLIAHAPADLAALCDEVESLRAAVERVRALHFGEYVEDEDRNRCFECGDDWPCPTLRALGATPGGE